MPIKNALNHYGTVDTFMKNRGQPNTCGEPDATRIFHKYKTLLIGARRDASLKVRVTVDFEAALKVFDPFQKE